MPTLSTRRTRPTMAMVVFAVATVGAVLAPPAWRPADAAITFGAPSPAVVAAAPDYATERLSDPWDYENPEDQRLDLKAGMLNVANARLEGSKLVFDTLQGASFDPLVTWADDLPWGRDPELHPIDATRYTRLSIRMRSSARLPGAVMWFNCPTRLPSCQGGMPFQIEAGWRTYDLELRPGFPDAALPWSGQITGLRIIPGNAAGTHIEVDWMRLFRPGPAVAVQWTDTTPGNAVDLLFDTDNDRANNTPENPGWGVWTTVARSNANNTTSFPASAYPPGTYRFYAVDDGTPSAYSAPLVIDSPPMPVIEDPDASGGADYATVARGDPWDFAQPTDAARVANATDIDFTGGVLNATNAPPFQNDPQVDLPLNGPIDGSRFHRLSFTLSYEGPFGLEDAPGGGTMARIIWSVAGAGANDFQELNDVVTYQGVNRVTVDLNTNPPTLVNDETQIAPRLGWTGRQITSLRFDPNEDPGQRRWHLDDVRLAEDDRGAGSFDIAFRDNAWEQGTTADLFADTDPTGFNGTQIATGIPVVAGRNIYRWAPTNLPAGRYWVYVVMRDARSTASAYSSGPVHMGSVSRLAGEDRIATAAAVAQSAFAAGAARGVVLARHDNFPDALAGTPLAASVGGPLLLTPSSGLDPRVEDTIRRLLPAGGTVHLLGGEGALSPAVAARLTQLGYRPTRHAGADRYETAVRIAEALTPRPAELFLTTGTNFPDALAAGAAAAKVKGAVLLTQGNVMPPSTAAFVASNQGLRRWAIGAPAAAADPTATSVSGANRYETSRFVAERFFPAPTAVGVASGENFPDALAGGAHLATLGAPLVLTPPAGLAGSVLEWLTANRASLARAFVYGGESAVSDNVRAQVEAAIA